MSRRSTPERIFAARRAALRYGLMDYGMPEQTANAWCDAWQDEADLPRPAGTNWPLTRDRRSGS